MVDISTIREKNINKDDLFLLMESYKNMIELSTTVLKTLEQLSKTDDSICLNSIEIMKSIKNNQDLIENLPYVLKDKAIVNLENTVGRRGEEHHDMSISIEKLSSKLNWSIVGLSTLCLALVGFVIDLLNKLYFLKLLPDLVEKLTNVINKLSN